MNKKLAAFCAQLGFSVTKNSAYGKYREYEVNLMYSAFDNAAPVRLIFSFYATDEQKRIMESQLRDLQIKFCNFNFHRFGLTFGLSDMTISKLTKRMPYLMDKFVEIISQNGGLNAEYCPVCGEKLSESHRQYNIGGAQITIDNDCVDKMNAVINAENQDFNAAPNNYLSGFFGALLGGLAGAIVAIILYVIGFYSALAAVVAVTLGTFLYQKFHGKPNKMMILIVSATTLVCMALSVFLIYVVASGIAAASEGLSMSAMDAFLLLMTDEEFSTSFYLDLIMVVLFSLIGVGAQVAYLFKKIKRNQTIQ